MDAATFLKKTKTPEPVSEQESSVKDLPNDDGKSNIVTFRDTTPSGLVVEYCPGDGAKVKRWYAVNGSRVPSVTTVLDSLAKDGLKFWGQGVGISGVLELFHRGKLTSMIDWQDNSQRLYLDEGDVATPESVLQAMKDEKLTLTYVLNKAGDRGTNVHSALEDWAKSGGSFFPTPVDFPDEERPYVEALLSWVDTLDGAAEIAGYEVMVGSEKHGFAGRYDLTIELQETREFIQKAYKRKDNVMIEVKPGRYTIDLKSSSGIYPGSHFRQLAGYELASVESGYDATDGQFVLHVADDGRYQFVPSTATAKDFLVVLDVYNSNKRLK